MDATFVVAIIFASGSLILQIIGRVQAWHLAVIAARTEVKTDLGREVLVKDVGRVHSLVDGTTSKLIGENAALASANAALREQVSGFVERDAGIAAAARTANGK